MTAKTIHLIAAARPNFMKIAPLYHALAETDDFQPIIVHTGQHYDFNMSDAFFRDLGLPEPHIHLEIGSGTHAEQTGRVMIAYEAVCLDYPPDWTIVVGDVNSTVAAAMVCAKQLIPVVHLEAGLRSRDRTMPEEVNRIITDALADLLWTPSPDGDENLLQEGISKDRIERVGNIMLDAFEMQRENIEQDTTADRLGVLGKKYAVLTLHRPSNVDDPSRLRPLVDQLNILSASAELVFPVHPRTRKNLSKYDLLDVLENNDSILLEEPLGYIQFMNLVLNSSLVITDSGGLQEETTYLNIPCLTLRPNTERPITLSEGTNRLIEPDAIVSQGRTALTGDWPAGRKPEKWDGKTAGRCVSSLRRHAFR
jgi:UDP-N-acetylglucosamine 2-epimerase (non-hydrolysing)